MVTIAKVKTKGGRVHVKCSDGSSVTVSLYWPQEHDATGKRIRGGVDHLDHDLTDGATFTDITGETVTRLGDLRIDH
jgi:hypothetical protein